MPQDRLSILCLCSQFKQEKGIHPLRTAEFRDLSALLERYGKTPGSLFHMSPGELLSMELSPEEARRLLVLLDRLPVIETMVGSYKSMGIHVLTSADPAYFPTLKATLGQNCPPVLCCIGDLSLGEKPAVGFVGSRDISPEDGKFAAHTVKKVLAQGCAIVSGGARGSDSISEGAALWQGGSVIEFPAVPLFRKLRDPDLIPFLERKQMLLASPVAPHVGFSTALATTRNRMIYAHSIATVVIRATECRGGTWSGATDALKHKLCPVLCRDLPYRGNQGLIQCGAIPIDNHWNGNLPNGTTKPLPHQENPTQMPEQFSLF